MHHVNDVINKIQKLLTLVETDVDVSVCIIAAYWHDVGRIVVDDSHEVMSSEMLRATMISIGKYSEDFINKCTDAVRCHGRYTNLPESIEGIILRDSDKLAYIGINRWSFALDSLVDMNKTFVVLDNARNKMLLLEESKILWDIEVRKLIEYLYNRALGLLTSKSIAI